MHRDIALQLLKGMQHPSFAENFVAGTAAHWNQHCRSVCPAACVMKFDRGIKGIRNLSLDVSFFLNIMFGVPCTYT